MCAWGIHFHGKIFKMSKKVKLQKSEKLGEIVGKRRPALGALFLFLGIIFLTAVADFRTGQEIFFGDGILSDFVPTTNSLGPNLCGKIGATFCVLSLYFIGAATWIIPVYLLWTGWLCFKRRPSVLDTAAGFAMVLSVVALSAFGAMAQRILDAPSVTEYFLSGRGGVLGELVFDDFLYPSIDIFGSAILLVCVCLFCMIVIFIEDPADTAAQLGSTVRKAPSVLPKFLSRMWFAFNYLPRKLFGLVALAAKRRAPRVVEVPSADKILSPDGVERVNLDTVGENGGNVSLQQKDNLSDEGFMPANDDMEDGARFVYVPKGGKRDKIPQDFISSDPDDMPDADEDTVSAADASGSFDNEPENEISHEAENSISGPEAKEESIDQDGDELQEVAGGKDGNMRPSDAAAKRSLKEVAAILGAGVPSGGGVEISDKEPKKEKLADNKNESGDALKIIRTQVEVVGSESEAEPKKKGNYEFPPLSLLADPPKEENVQEENYEARMEEIIKTFDTFKIKVTRASVSPGPVVTLYEVYPAPGVKVNKISNMEDDLALALRAMKVRIIAPVPGKGTVGIEVPNLRRQTVYMKDVVLSKAWAQTKAVLPVVIGKDVTGNPKVLDLAKMPHALVAGATGSGKSVCINAIITSLLYRFTPDDLRMIMVDPKVVELKVYNDLPHMLIPVVTDPRKVPAALKWLMGEMDRRYKVFAAANVRNIAEFNAKILKDKEEQAKAEEMSGDMTEQERAAAIEAETQAQRSDVEIPHTKIPYIVCIIDELSDLMLIAGKEVEAAIMRITALARAAGIHLLVATQRPSADVVTGVIKANLPTRIGFKVSSQVDSRTILDSKGAESLLGMGDMLFVPPGTSDLVRAQGVFLSSEETHNIVNFLKTHNGEPEFLTEIEDQMNASLEEDSDDTISDDDSSDEAYVKKAMDVIKRSGKASTSNLQRRLGIGYNKAARIMDIMEERGYIGPDNGPGRPREIFF